MAKLTCTCDLCRKNLPPSEFMPSSSAFFPQGHINICYKCLQSTVDGNDLNQVDRLLQHANMAFLPQEWRKLWKREGIEAFRGYANRYNDMNYYKYDWSEQNEKLMNQAKQGIVETELEELRPAFLDELRLKWGDGLSDTDLIRLETNYNNIVADYALDEETQRDIFKKLCYMSLYLDKGLQSGKADKDMLSQYNNLMTTAQKNVQKKQTNAITSVSQIVEFIERNGYKANFYDDIPRDEIDLMIAEIKEYIADLVRGESNLPEIYAQIKQKYQAGENDDIDMSEIRENIEAFEEEEEDKENPEGFVEGWS